MSLRDWIRYAETSRKYTVCNDKVDREKNAKRPRVKKQDCCHCALKSESSARSSCQGDVASRGMILEEYVKIRSYHASQFHAGIRKDRARQRELDYCSPTSKLREERCSTTWMITKTT